MPRNRVAQAREFLANKDKDPSRLWEALAVSVRVYAETLFALLQCDDKRAKNRAAKLIANLSEHDPRSVNPHWNELIECATGKENILRWNALIAIGFVTRLDSSERVRSLLPKLYKLIQDESMVTAGHAVTCLGKIALAHEEYRRTILRRLMTIDESSRDPECNQILAGKVLAALEPFIPDTASAKQASILDYAKEYEQSHRSSTRKLATKLVKKFQQKTN